MPVLSIDISKGAATALLVEDDLTYKISRFPVMYPDIHYAHKPVLGDVFNFLISELEDKFGTKLSDKAKIFVSTYRSLGVEIKNAEFCDKSEAFRSLYPLDFVYFSHLHVGSNTGIFSKDIDYKLLLKDILFDEDEEVVMNYFENLNLYPHTLPSSDRDRYEEEAYLKYVARRHCNVVGKEPFQDQRSVLFSTTRLIETDKEKVSFMFLCLESLCNEGWYSFKLDSLDFVGAVSAVSFFDKSTYEKIEFPDFLALGTVINIIDDVSCVVSKDGGGVNEFNLKKDEIFTYPLPFEEEVVLKISSKKHGNLERTVRGGEFGVVVDTRDKLNVQHESMEKRKAVLKGWENTLMEGLKGL